MAEVVEYRSRLEKERRASIGNPVVISMQNERDEGYRRARDEQKRRQLRMALASALRGLYIAYSDNPALIDAIKTDADIEARKILSCGNE